MNSNLRPGEIEGGDRDCIYCGNHYPNSYPSCTECHKDAEICGGGKLCPFPGTIHAKELHDAWTHPMDKSVKGEDLLKKHGCPGCAGPWHPSSECPVYSPKPTDKKELREKVSSLVAKHRKLNRVRELKAASFNDRTLQESLV